MQRILVIDDDVELCELVGEYLEPDGYKVEAVHDGHEGIRRALSGDHALVVLDYMLPGLNGFEVLRQIRAQSRLPIVMLTARGDDLNRIIGLQIGADDYLPKPFNPLELVARINAVLRRSQSQPDHSRPEVIAVGDIELDNGLAESHRAELRIAAGIVGDGNPVDLVVVDEFRGERAGMQRLRTLGRARLPNELFIGPALRSST